MDYPSTEIRRVADSLRIYQEICHKAIIGEVDINTKLEEMEKILKLRIEDLLKIAEDMEKIPQ